MNKFFIISFLFLGLSGCITKYEKSISNKTKTHLDLSQNKIKDDVIEYKFIQWKCYKSSWLNKYKELIYVVGYFPEFQKFDKNNRIGMSFLNNTKSKKLAIYSRQGVQHYWDWGGENFNNYRIIIHPSGNGWLYNFENRKSNEQKRPNQTYDCKSSKTTSIPINNIKNVINELNDVPNFEETDLKNNLQIHMQKCFKLNFPTTKVFKNNPKVTIQIFINENGIIKKTNILNRKKYESDFEYKTLADIATKAVMNCIHLPIPENETRLFKNFIMNFDSNFIYKK